jgi:ParB-like chromosome segregation protein Spo0J|tara:strand:- start:3156 stop:3743 length:588 start_codon:yes stop_codon:yes gene_type:complete
MGIKINKMKIEQIDIKKIIANNENPRTIKNEKFDKLCESIKNFPEMMEIRPIVVNDNYEILGGNMRFRACKVVGLKKVPIIKAKNLTEEQQKEFIIKDNVNAGQWDWDMLGNEWDSLKLGDWGMDVWQPEKEVDYSILDDFEMDDELENKEKNVKKGVLIEFNPEDYDEAMVLINEARDNGNYLGGILVDALKKL